MRDHDRAPTNPYLARIAPATDRSASASVAPADAVQRRRRALFVSLLGVVLLPALVSVLLPDAGAQETVVATAEPEQSTAASEVTIGATTVPPSTEPSSTSVSHTTTSTSRHKATTTTTAKPRPTTTSTSPVRPKSSPAPVAAPSPPAVAAAAPAGSGASADEAAFLACVRRRESGGNYSVVSSNGMWYGAYQMTRQTWDSAAAHAGRPDLIGVPPNQASPADQDYVALMLYRWLGKGPWGGAC